MPLRRLSSARHAIGGMSRQATVFLPGTRDADTGATPPPSPAFTTWADIRVLSGQELDKAQQIAQETEHVITIPFQGNVQLDGTVEFEGRSFQIKYIEDEDERHFFLDLYCAEIGQNAGSAS